MLVLIPLSWVCNTLTFHLHPRQKHLFTLNVYKRFWPIQPQEASPSPEVPIRGSSPTHQPQKEAHIHLTCLLETHLYNLLRGSPMLLVLEAISPLQPVPVRGYLLLSNQIYHQGLLKSKHSQILKTSCIYQPRGNPSLSLSLSLSLSMQQPRSI